MTGVDKSPVQQIVATVKESYLVDIRNRTTNYINDTVVGVLTHLQENYVQVIPRKLLDCKDIIKKRIYNPRYPIATILFAVEELLEFSDISRTLYMHEQSVNIAYIIIHRTRKFGLEICEWSCMTTDQRTCIRFKQFCWTSHQ